MKTRKSLLVAALSLVALTVSAQYQGQGPRQGGQNQGQRQRMTVQGRAEREAARIHSACELSDAQIAQVYTIAYKYAAQDSVRMEKMRAEYQNGGQPQNFDREAWMKERQQVQDAKTAEFNAVLTKEQQAKYQKMLEEQASQFGPRGGQGGPQGQGPRQGGPQQGQGPRQGGQGRR